MEVIQVSREAGYVSESGASWRASAATVTWSEVSGAAVGSTLVSQILGCRIIRSSDGNTTISIGLAVLRDAKVAHRSRDDPSAAHFTLNVEEGISDFSYAVTSAAHIVEETVLEANVVGIHEAQVAVEHHDIFVPSSAEVSVPRSPLVPEDVAEHGSAGPPAFHQHRTMILLAEQTLEGFFDPSTLVSRLLRLGLAHTVHSLDGSRSFERCALFELIEHALDEHAIHVVAAALSEWHPASGGTRLEVATTKLESRHVARNERMGTERIPLVEKLRLPSQDSFRHDHQHVSFADLSAVLFVDFVQSRSLHACVDAFVGGLSEVDTEVHTTVAAF